MAFRHFEQHEKRIMFVLAILAIIAFGVGGAPTIIRTVQSWRQGEGAVYATVFDEPLRASRDAYFRRQVLMQVGAMPQFSRLIDPGIKEEHRDVIYPLFQANLKVARDAGVVVSNEQFAEELKFFLQIFRAQQNIPFDEEFDLESAFQDYLDRFEIDRRTFEQVFRDVLTVKNWMNTLEASAAVDPENVWTEYRFQNRKADIRYAAIEADAFRDEIPEPDEATLRNHFVSYRNIEDPETGLNTFDIPPQATVEYLMARREAFMDEVEITEEAIRNYYETHKDALARVEPDEGDDDRSQYKPLADVREKVVAAYKKEKAARKMRQVMESLLDTVTDYYYNFKTDDDEDKQPISLAEFVDRVPGLKGRVKAGTVGPFSREEAENLEPFGAVLPASVGGQVTPDPLAELAFTADRSKGAEAVLETERGDMIVIRRKGEVQPARTPQRMEPVKERVLEHYMNQKTLDKAVALADKVEKALTSQRPADSVLKAYFNEKRQASDKPVGKRPFDIPERVKVDYIKSNIDAFGVDVPDPTQEDLRAYYEEHREKYKVSGPDDPQVSYRPFEEVQVQINEILRKRRAREKMKEAMVRLLDTIKADMKEGAVEPLESYVKGDEYYGKRVTVGSTEPFSRTEATGVPEIGQAFIDEMELGAEKDPLVKTKWKGRASLADLAFSDNEVYRGSELILKLPDEGEYVIVRRTARIPGRAPKSFEAVEDKVLQRWREEHNLRHDWEPVKPLLGEFEVNDPEPFGPGATEPEVAERLGAAIFFSTPGAVVNQEVKPVRTVFVVTVDALLPPERAEFERDTQLAERIRANRLQQTQSIRLNAYFEYLLQNIQMVNDEREDRQQQQ